MKLSLLKKEYKEILVKFFSIGFLILFTLACLLWFVINLNALISGIFNDLPIISFDKGSTYMLGAGIFGLVIIIAAFIKVRLKKTLATKSTTFFVNSLIFSFILMFGFPHIAHYAVNRYAQQENYKVCNAATYRSRLYSIFYYTKTNFDCNKLVEQRTIRN